MKMTVDRTTIPRRCILCLKDDEDFNNLIEEARKKADSEGLNTGEEDKLIMLELSEMEASECYYEDEILHLSFLYKGGDIDMEIPISDVIMIDIITSGIRKLNKFKTVLESL